MAIKQLQYKSYPTTAPVETENSKIRRAFLAKIFAKFQRDSIRIPGECLFTLKVKVMDSEKLSYSL